VPLGNRVFEKLAIYFPKLNKIHRIYTRKHTQIYPKKISSKNLSQKNHCWGAEGEPACGISFIPNFMISQNVFLVKTTSFFQHFSTHFFFQNVFSQNGCFAKMTDIFCPGGRRRFGKNIY
jgi:hypothetical protein